MTACGGDDSGSSPADQCKALETQLCDRITECVAGGAGMQDQCLQGIDSTAPCSAVKSVGASYQQCIDLLNSQTCSQLFPTDSNGLPQVTLPQECAGVLQSGGPARLGAADPLTRAIGGALLAPAQQ
jgi:hypothetical protein